MATPIKIRDMFLVPPGGGRVVLNPGSQYAMTRQGVVTTAPELPELPELEDGRPEALRAYNTNALVALGSRGDLRQLEALYGNVTNLYNNAVLEADVLHSSAPSDRYVSKTVDLANSFYDKSLYVDTGEQKGVPTAFSVPAPTSADTFHVHLYGSDSPSGPWTLLYSTSMSYTLGAIARELTGIQAYRYFRADPGAVMRLFPSRLTVTIKSKSLERSKFLTRAESARIAELIADPYNAHIFIEGGVPVGEDILTLMIPSPVSLPANLVGSYLHCGTKPSAAFAITLYKNTTSLGTLTINTSGGFAATITATSFAKGDKLRLVPQTVGDVALADLAMTLHMKRV